MKQKRKARSLLAALLAALLLLAALPLSAYAADDVPLEVSLDGHDRFQAAVEALSSPPSLDTVTTLTITGGFNNDKRWSAQDGSDLIRNFPALDTLDMKDFIGTYSNSALTPGTNQSTKIRRVRLPAGVVIPDRMFGDLLRASLASLTTLVCGAGNWQDGVIDLTGARDYGDYAFYACTAITQVRLSAGIEISDYMFRGCTSLKTLVCGDGNFEQGVINLTGYTGNAYGTGLFTGCHAIEQVRLPDSIAISDEMFAVCENLTTLVCGSGSGAFEPGVIDLTGYNGGAYGASSFTVCFAIEQVRLPDSIGVSNGMFNSCTGLKRLTFVGSSSTPPSVGTYAFYDVPASGGTLYYPPGATGYDQLAAGAGLTDWRVLPIGYVDPVAPTPAAPVDNGTPHVCDFGGWQYSNEHHWKRCSCTALSDYAPHVFNSARVCTVCGYGAKPKKFNPPTGVYDSYSPR